MRVAIFNGFPFHYEVFGYIINWCKQQGYHLTLYTETKDSFGWFEWYTERFGTLHIQPINNFERACHNYHIIFLITDNDRKFSDRWVNLFDLQATVISIDHHRQDRRKNITKHLAVRDFPHKPHAYPVYPIDVNLMTKVKSTSIFNQGIHIYLQAVPPECYNWDVLNKLQQDEQITFHVAGRVKHNMKLTRAKYYGILPTIKLLRLIARCHYVFYCMSAQSKYYRDICSGTVPLAFNCGTPLLMTSDIAGQYNFHTSVIYPEYTPYDSSVRSRVTAERDTMIAHFDTTIRQLFPMYYSKSLKSHANTDSIPKVIHFMWLSPNNGPVPEKYLPNIEQFRQFNPNYEIRIWNMDQAQESLTLVDERYARIWNEANLVITKCDFLRMLILYIHGGLYVDLDFYCLDSVDSLLVDKDIMVCRELPEHEPQYKQLFNGFIGAKPGHEFIEGWIEYMTCQLEEKLPITVRQVMETTGPVGFWRYYETVDQPPELSDPCKIMPFTNKNKRSSACPLQPSVAHTVWHEGSGWSSEDSDTTLAWGLAILVILIVLIVIFIIWWMHRRNSSTPMLVTQ